ncbi:rod shape-determining protein [Candidatus Chlorohelix sp.]|uniref:rod shape-determining protein n=1 Tax=Candidatus Chlorohelix sp. TaxID=3139201 RepID=UPI00306086D8
MWNLPNLLFGLFSRDLGIDLGTANTLVHVRGKGIVISEPSYVAIDKKTKEVKAVGADAKAMAGKTPASIIAIRPLRDGVIADFDVVEQMLHEFIRKVHTQTVVGPRPRVVIGIPSGVTEVEKRAAREASLNAGAREAYVVEEPMAAAIGAGLPVNEPIGSMIVDIGGGTTEVAVISLGGIVINHSLRTAGDEIDEAIIQYARREHNLVIGERTAESAKIACGSAYPLEQELRFTLRGRDVLTGLPKAVELSSVELREAIAGPVNSIVETVKLALEETPPELVADIMERGITLAGGGALLLGLDRRLQMETKMPVYVADDPLTCVVRGTGIMVESLEDEKYRRIIASSQEGRRLKYSR